MIIVFVRIYRKCKTLFALNWSIVEIHGIISLRKNSEMKVKSLKFSREENEIKEKEYFYSLLKKNIFFFEEKDMHVKMV